MEQSDLIRLAAALGAASQAGLAFKDDPDEVGSCNIDCMVLPTGPHEVFKRASKGILDAIKGAGLKGIWRASGEWRGYHIRHGSVVGQRSRNEQAIEAMVRVMEERGWKVLHYQQMD